MFGSFVYLSRTGGAAPLHDLTTDNLSLWLRGPSITGSLTTLAWPGTASAGSSASHNMSHDAGYDDLVDTVSADIDSRKVARWKTADPYPRLTSNALMRDDLLGATANTQHSYTIAAVVSLLSSSSGNLTGGKVNSMNPCLITDGSYFGLPVLDVGGSPKIGVFHYDATAATEDGTTPIDWTPGWNAYALMWVRYNHSSGVCKVRVDGADVYSATLGYSRGAAGAGGLASMGATGGGAYTLGMKVAEVLAWPGQNLTDPELLAREAALLAVYPSLAP